MKSESKDVFNDAERFMDEFKKCVAKAYNKSLSENIKRGIAQAKANGTYGKKHKRGTNSTN